MGNDMSEQELRKWSRNNNPDQLKRTNKLLYESSRYHFLPPIGFLISLVTFYPS